MLEMIHTNHGQAPVTVDEDELLTVDDLKRIFHVKESTARKYYQVYGLRAVRLPGREVRFTRAAVREFIGKFEQV